jgi:hypothetical protein
VFQQTCIDDANSTLQKIYNAETVFQTYQSNNAMFNAIIELVDDEKSVERIRRVQIYNYELGLRDMEALIDDEAREDIPKPFNAFSGSPGVDVGIKIAQERLQSIQGKLASQKESIIQKKSALNKVFLFLYAVGSMAVVLGSILNVTITVKLDDEKNKSKSIDWR